MDKAVECRQNLHVSFLKARWVVASWHGRTGRETQELAVILRSFGDALLETLLSSVLLNPFRHCTEMQPGAFAGFRA